MADVAVRGHYRKGDGTAASGQVTFTPRPQAVNDSGGGDILASSVVTATLDAAGKFTVTLQASDDPTLAPTGWTYLVTETIVGASAQRSYDIKIPASAAGVGINLWDVAPASPASGDPTTFPTLAAFAALDGRVGAQGSGRIYLASYMGSGISHTTALKNAVAASAGKMLVLGSTALTIEDVIQISADDVTIDARGAVITLVDNGTAEGRIIRFLNCARPTWLGGTINQPAPARAGVYGLLTAVNCQDLTIDSPTIIGGSSTSVFGQQLNGFMLRNIRSRGSKADGIHISRGSTDGHIVSPLVVAAQDDAIAIVSVMADGATTYSQCARIAITDPIVRNLTVLGSGIAIVGPKDVTVTGGVIDDPVDAGVKVVTDTVAGTHAPSDISITGLRVRSCTDSFRIGDATDVTIENVTGLGGSGLGFYLANATRAHIVGGKVRGHTDVGVYSTGGAGNNLIGVDLRGNSAPSAGVAHTLTSCVTA